MLIWQENTSNNCAGIAIGRKIGLMQKDVNEMIEGDGTLCGTEVIIKNIYTKTDYQEEKKRIRISTNVTFEDENGETYNFDVGGLNKGVGKGSVDGIYRYGGGMVGWSIGERGILTYKRYNNMLIKYIRFYPGMSYEKFEELSGHRQKKT